MVHGFCTVCKGVEEIAQHEERNKEGVFTKTGAFEVDTGIYTGRSPQDKYFVEREPSKSNIWWSPIPPNKPVSEKVFNEVYDDVKKYMNGKEVYVFDGYCGANPKSRKCVRFITEYAWQHHFVTNMFVRPKSEEEIRNFKPDFTVINTCKGLVNKNWKRQGLNSEAFVGFDLENKLALVVGAKYGGEMKKGIFGVMNYELPLHGILSMHCSANVGKDGDSALFFGLSGTGKTTLSADPKRFLIGDDEHGWDDDGIFNFEGGCYAKTINLSREKEPDIWNAIKRNALLENVMVKPDGSLDFNDVSKTQNGRVAYPIYHIPNYKKDSMAGHPKAIIFLTCDAYGVLPPISKLTTEQAMYHFLCGYTAKVAGTERGIKEPVPNFSPCFGGAFMPLNPVVYAKLLGEKLNRHGTRVYLLNTGWTGGGYGVGKRMDIPVTRACIDGILNGSIEKAPLRYNDRFNLEVPTHVEGVDDSLLWPRNTWKDKEEYDRVALKLAGKFVEHFKQFQVPGLPDYSPYGPTVN